MMMFLTKCDIESKCAWAVEDVDPIFTNSAILTCDTGALINIWKKKKQNYKQSGEKCQLWKNARQRRRVALRFTHRILPHENVQNVLFSRVVGKAWLNLVVVYRVSQNKGTFG